MSAHQTPQREWLHLPERAPLDWRIGGLADSPAVAMLAERSFEPHFREAWTEAQIAALLATSGAWLDLGHAATHLAAFAMSRQTFEDVELLLCAVAPDRRGIGDGRRMMEQVAGSARGRGARRLFLEVRHSNAPALSLYRSAGFKVEGRRPGYYRTLGGESIDAITLSLSL
jgi:[ribosomal protein S18]-alanine N-acetyltransferase